MQKSNSAVSAPAYPQPSAPSAADCAAADGRMQPAACPPVAGGRTDVKEITAGGRTFHGYVKSVEEEKKKVTTTYVEVMPDGTERELVVKEKKKKDQTDEALFWGAVLGFAIFD